MTTLNSSAPANNIANIGGVDLSFTQIQSIYNEITGKNESMSKFFRDAHEITMDDINQLDIKIKQLLEPYDINSTNCYITIYYANDSKSKYSSFERFKMQHDSSSMSVCEGIRLEYNFLIILPQTNKPQSYKIKMELHSRVGIRKSSLSEHGSSRRFFGMIAGRVTGNIEIEYVNYNVARSFLTAIDDWHSSVKKSKSSKIINFLRDKSEHLPHVFQLLTIFILTSVFYNYTNGLSTESVLPNLSKLVFIFGSIYFSSLFALKMGRISENLIDSYQPISFIKINRGDEQEIKEYKKSNIKNFCKFILSAIMTILINIVSSSLYAYIID